MTELADDTEFVATYPSSEQHEHWKDRADELDMSVSEFIQSMVEAGIKIDQGVEVDLTRDESVSQLRRQRNDLKQELDEARSRISDLETRLHRGERKTIEEFIESNPGASYAEVIQHVADTVPERVVEHLETLEGESITPRDGEYYPLSSTDHNDPE